nr:LysR family transcriptional regulator [Paenibacillus elgii]
MQRRCAGIDIRQLEYVLEIIRHSSFTKAAEALHITQPTISKAVKNLEEELGVPLFVRSGKTLELTDAGQLIAGQAQDVVRSFKHLELQLGDLTNFKKGHIRIGLPPMAGARFFPGILSRFRDTYPGLTIQLEEDGSVKLAEKVEDGTLDVGVVLLPVDEGVFESYSFVNERLRAVLPPAHPLAGKKEVRLVELQDEAFILFREDFALHERIIEACDGVGFRPRIWYESSQWDFIYEMVAAGMGVALLPESICGMLDPNRVATVTLTDPAIPWHLGMIWRKDRYLSFAAREWVRFSKAHLTNQGRPSL